MKIIGAYVYRHVRLDTNEPFYIGIGKDERYNRAFIKHKRSSFWNRVVNNCKGDYDVEILLTNLTWEEAIDKEKEFIKLYGRKDLGTGSLVNLTDGGEGHLGFKPTTQTLNKMSKALSGVNNPMFGRKVSEEYGLKISKSLTGLKQSEETKSKRAKALMKKVIDTSNNKIYNSISEAAAVYSLKTCMLSKYLNGKIFNKTSLQLYKTV